MEKRSSYHLGSQLVLGSIVVLLGVVFTLDNLNILDAGEFLQFWPVLLIICGLYRIVVCETPAGKIWGALWVLIGGILLLNKLYVIHVYFWDLWPLILVFIGVSLMLRSTRRRHELAVGSSGRAADSNSTISAFALLGGLKRTNDSQDFRGGEATAIMGGCEIDLRQASIKEGDAVLDLFAFWGGIEVRVPEEWSVVLEGIPVLGGYEDNSRPPKGEARKRLIIKGYAVMGGVEIKN
jgi:predicted membrane protein